MLLRLRHANRLPRAGVRALLLGVRISALLLRRVSALLWAASWGRLLRIGTLLLWVASLLMLRIPTLLLLLLLRRQRPLLPRLRHRRYKPGPLLLLRRQRRR